MNYGHAPTEVSVPGAHAFSVARSLLKCPHLQKVPVVIGTWTYEG